MKNGNNIGGILTRKNRGWCSLLVMMLGNAFRVQYTFLYMESVAMLNEKSNKIGKITKTQVNSRLNTTRARPHVPGFKASVLKPN